MREKQIQDAFEMWLRERQIPFLRSRMDKASTIAKGWPDFTVLWCGRVCLIETKTETGKLSQEQKDTIAMLQRNGCAVTVARSVEECCEAARNILTEIGRDIDAVASFPDAIRKEWENTKAVVAAVVPANGKPREFLGNIGTAQYVFAGDGTPGSDTKMLRRATAEDVIRLNRI